jgi:quinolinate synthase
MLEHEEFQNRLLSKAPPQSPQKLSEAEKAELVKTIKKLLQEKNAMLIAHYYTDADIQQLAEETGGFIGDSLEMAKVGAQSPAEILVIAGVRFMGETAKILSPDKTVLLPDAGAECSLDIGCEPEEFSEFCAQHPDRTVVVYANTSAAVKAVADWTVTSSIAVDVIKHLHDQGQKIIWAPDKYLGNYIQKQTGADMLLWNAYCTVHAEFDAHKLHQLKCLLPGAPVLVHPESRPEVIELADVVGSTSQLLKATQNSKADKFIVATEKGILYKMQQACPDKEFVFAPTSKQAEVLCEGSCPWMKMNSLANIAGVLQQLNNQVELPRNIIDKALVPLQRMVKFGKK